MNKLKEKSIFVYYFDHLTSCKEISTFYVLMLASTFYGSSMSPSSCFIVMEYMELGSLDSILQKVPMEPWLKAFIIFCRADIHSYEFLKKLLKEWFFCTAIELYIEI